MPWARSVLRFSTLALLLFLLPIAAASQDRDPRLPREILERVGEWPGTRVEVPLKLYRQFVIETVLGEKPARSSAPAGVLPLHLHYQILGIADPITLRVRYRCQVLETKNLAPIRIFPAAHAWEKIQVNGKPAQLRVEDGWLVFEPKSTGRFEITAEAAINPKRTGVLSAVKMPRPKTAQTTVSVDSEVAVDMDVSGAARRLVGNAKAGTHGTVGLVSGNALSIRWQPARAQRDRSPRIETRTILGVEMGTSLAEIKAQLAVTLSGGATDTLSLRLPPGADRVAVSGPDVDRYADRRVRLKGRITGTTLLNVTYARRVPKGKPIAITGPSIAGATRTGGEVVLAGGTSTELIETAVRAAEAVDLTEISGEVRGLVARPPVMAYRLRRGDWRIGVEALSVAAFEAAETIVDDAAYTLIFRPDGNVMVAAALTVRNARRQFLGFQLPSEATLLSVRVSEEKANPVRGSKGELLVPMKKSVESLVGMVSFPLEIAYVLRGQAFLREGGTYSFALPRPDAPVAYARVAVYVPHEVEPGGTESFTGLFKKVEKYGLEEAEAEFTYGQGYLEKADTFASALPSRPTHFSETAAASRPGSEGTVARTSEPAENLPPQRASGGLETSLMSSPPSTRRSSSQRGYLRAGTKAFEKGDFDEAEELLKRAHEINPKSAAGKSSLELMDVSRVAQGKYQGKDKRTRAKQKQVLFQIREKNIDMLNRQEGYVRKALKAEEAGRFDDAAADWLKARELSEALTARGESQTSQAGILAQSGKAIVRYKEAAKQNRELKKRLKSVAEKQLTRADEVVRREGAIKEQMARVSEGMRQEGVADGKDFGAMLDASSEEDFQAEDAEREVAIDSLRGTIARLESDLDKSVSDEVQLKALARSATDGALTADSMNGPEWEADNLAEENVKLQKEVEKFEASSKHMQRKLEEIVNKMSAEGIVEAHPSIMTSRGGETTTSTRSDYTFDAPSALKSQSELDAFNQWAYRNRANWSLGKIGELGKGSFQLSADKKKLVYQDKPDEEIRKLMQTFKRNRGLKVRVSSYNSGGFVREVAEVGGVWKRGENGLRYALLDAGQVETLLERDVLGAGKPSPYENKLLHQETILGSQVRLSNDTTVVLAKADEKANTLSLLGNPIMLEHDSILAVWNRDNTFTLVQIGKVYAWGVSIEEEYPFTVPAPKIEVPEIGRLIKLEKIFARDEDEFIVQFDYSWEGD